MEDENRKNKEENERLKLEVEELRQLQQRMYEMKTNQQSFMKNSKVCSIM